MSRTRLHCVLIAGSAAAIGVGAARHRAVVQIVDATLPDARGIANFNRPGTITLLASDGKVIQLALQPGEGEGRENAIAGNRPSSQPKIGAFMSTTASTPGAWRGPW